MIVFKFFKLKYKCILSIMVIMVFSTLFFVNNLSFGKSEDSIELPIIMYHSILKSQKGTFIIHPDTFENDLKYIKEKGYSTITMTDLINYVYYGIAIPDKSIIITFDDGYYNNLSYVVPLLHKYDMKAVVSIVGSFTDTYTNSNEANPNYGYLRWKDISDLMTDGCIEFQNHTYNMHSDVGRRKGCKKILGESTDEYTKLLSSDLNKLQEKFKQNCNEYVPNTFTYPYGAVSKESISIIKSLGFKASLSCSSGLNYISKDPDCLYMLKRFNRKSKISTKNFFDKVLD